MRVLFFKWQSLMTKGVEKALKHIQPDSIVFEYDISDYMEDEQLDEILCKCIRNNIVTTVLSINFLPVVSCICEKMGIRYISWGYDSPVKEAFLPFLNNSCNVVYDFDRGQVEEWKRKGINAHHMSLAADVDSFLNFKKNTYRMDVSFVGKLYLNDYAILYTGLHEEMQNILQEIIRTQIVLGTKYVIPALMTEELVNIINHELYERGVNKSFTKYQMEYLLACEVARRERVLALTLLSKHFHTTLYSPDHLDLKELVQLGIVDYYTEMPSVFAESRINLHYSLKAIRTGISLRVLDVMACGGFLMSSAQDEICENFKVGEECEIFHSPQELYEKVDYYLKNENLRERIALSGLETVKRKFTFEDRLRRILS